MVTKYVTQVMPKSRCLSCGERPTLLTHENPTRKEAMFFICWKCKTVAEVGKGPVPLVSVQ